MGDIIHALLPGAASLQAQFPRRPHHLARRARVGSAAGRQWNCRSPRPLPSQCIRSSWRNALKTNFAPSVTIWPSISRAWLNPHSLPIVARPERIAGFGSSVVRGEPGRPVLLDTACGSNGHTCSRSGAWIWRLARALPIWCACFPLPPGAPEGGLPEVPPSCSPALIAGWASKQMAARILLPSAWLSMLTRESSTCRWF